MKVYSLKFLCSCLLLSACSFTANTEICNTEGAVHNYITTHYEEILEMLSDPTVSQVAYQIQDKTYIFYRYNSIDGFFISTNQGYGPEKTQAGFAGYYFSPSGEPAPPSFEYLDQYMGNNIYCYKRK